MSCPPPDDPTWVRSGRLGDPAPLELLLDILRQGRDWLQIIDPLAQGLATIAELEFRLVEVFQALSAPRSAGLLLAEALMEFLKEYLTDGVYFVQHGNTRELFERTGTAQFIEGMEQYVQNSDLENLAAKQGELSSFVQFGPEADPEGGAFQSYRRYPEIIEGQLNLRRREAVKSALDAFQDVEFNAFNDWLNPIIAAFYDPGDPNKPVVFDNDKVGGFLFAVQGQDPLAVYESFLQLKSVFEEIVTQHLDFSDFYENLEADLGIDTISTWELADSLQWNGLNSPLKPHLVPRYSSSPDFERLSTADILPALGDFLLDASNLVEFAGFPYPENFSLLNAAERLAQKVRKYLEAYDKTIELLTRIADVMNLADVWRLYLPPETGGISNLVDRIKNAPRDDTVRITWGTITAGVNNDGSPTLQEFEYSRIKALPADTSGIAAYNGEQPGDWMLKADLFALAAEFTLNGRDGFEYSPASVIRAGETMRTSHAEKLQEVFPSLSFGPPGNLMIYGVGIFVVEGALSRLLASLFAPQQEDWDEWLCNGPQAVADPGAIAAPVTDALPPTPSGTFDLQLSLGRTGVEQALDGAPFVDTDAGFDIGDPADAAAEVTADAPPERVLRRLDRYGSARSVEHASRAIVSTPSARPRNIYLKDVTYPTIGGATMSLGDEGSTWTFNNTPRLSDASIWLRVPAFPAAPTLRSSPFTELPTEVYQLDPRSDMGVGFPVATETIFDAVIQPGGTNLLSPVLWDRLSALGFPGADPDQIWILDLKLSYSDGVGRWVRCTIKAYDPGGAGFVYVYPALPCTPILSSNVPVSAKFFVDDDPILTIKPGAPAPEDGVMAADSPGVMFDLAASWRKTVDAGSRAGTLDAQTPLTLQAIAGHHVAAVDSDAWGDVVEFDVEQGAAGNTLSITSGALAGSVRDFTRLPGWPPGDIQGEGTFSVGEEISSKPAEPLGFLRGRASALGVPVTVHSQNDASPALFSPTAEKPEIGDFWRPLSTCCPRLVRVGLGPVTTDDVRVYTQPSLWSYLLFTDGVTWTREELTELNGGAPPDDVLGLLVDYPHQKSWHVKLSASVAATHAGKSFVLVSEISAAAGLNDEVTYGRVRPFAWFCPWIRAALSDEQAPEVGDHLALSARPWTRAGVGPAYGQVFGGADGVESGSIWYETIPTTGTTSLRPRSELRGGAVALELVLGQDTWALTASTWEVIRGGSHRVLAEVTSVGVDWSLQERDPLGGTWFERASVSTSHLLMHDHIAVVFDAIPASSLVDLMVSRLSGGGWSVLNLSQVTVLEADPNPTVRTLEGLKEAGGTWRIGRPSWRSSVFDTGVRLPWDTDEAGVSSGMFPCGYADLRYLPLSVDAPEEMLDLYR